MTFHSHNDRQSCTKGCPQYDPREWVDDTPGVGDSQPDFDEFAHNPLEYAKTQDTRPSEAQERVARELRGFFVALKEAGFDRDDAIATLGAIFDAKSRGEEFTL